MRKCSRLLVRMGLGIVLLLVAGGDAWAQSASISGIVTDVSGAVVSGARVELLNEATAVRQDVVSNRVGLYTLATVPPGNYQLTIGATGFETERRTHIVVEVGAKISLDISLKVGKATDQVVVDGSGANINTVDASVSTVIDHRFVENLPLNGRSFQSLITINPGTAVVPSQGSGMSGEISVNGQRTEANYFILDGISANTGATVSSSGYIGAGFSGATPQSSAFGTTQSIISIDALDEFRALTSTYSAEYGRSPGGQFTFSSRSGTNDYHGTAFDFLRNDAMDANNWFNNYFGTSRPPLRQNDFGGTLGGPIRIPHLYNGKDRTFFFFSYEALRLTSPQAAQLYEVPTDALRTQAPKALQPFLAGFPIANGPDQGNGLAYYTAGYSAPSSLDNRSIRVDHAFSDRMKLFGRYTDVPSYSLSRQSTDLAQVNNNVRNVKMAVLGLDTALNSSMANELRFGLTGNDYYSQRYLDNFGGATPLDVSAAPGLAQNDWMTFFLFYGLYPYYLLEPQQNKQRQINVVDNFTQTIGRHTLKYGVDYRRLFTSERLAPLWEVAFYSDENSVLNNTPAGLYVYTQGTNMHAVNMNFSAFAQDEWRVTDRLSLSLGLRWDLNPPPSDANGNTPYTVTQVTDLATTALAPKNSPLWKTTWNNFAPRVGVAYQIHRTPGRETVLRVGAGVFYDTGTELSAEGYYGVGTTGFASYTSPFPATLAQVQATPQPSAAAPYNAAVWAYDPNLKQPYTTQWNVAIEQGLGAAQSLTVNYVGSDAQRLLVQRFYHPEFLGNAAFSGGSGLYVTSNAADSNYNSLQVRFERKMASGLQFLGSYTWSKGIDTATSNFTVYTLERAVSDYDIRNNFQAALSYDIGGHYDNRYLSYALRHWSLDTRISARSALPIDVEDTATIDTSAATAVIYHPDYDSTKPLYLKSSVYPGGKAINFDAFTQVTGEGNSGRNIARGFDAVQADLTLRRDFPIHDRLGLQFRAEAYNFLNHPIYGNLYNSLSTGAALFGQAYNTENSALGGLGALYQVGGPRSLQMSLKLHF